MRLPDKVKFLLVLCSGLIFFIPGCVDTNVQTIPDEIIYHSQVQITNLVAGAGSANLTLNGTSFGTVGYGEDSDNMTVQAGGKTLDANFANAGNKSYIFSTESDLKFRIFLIGTSASTTVVKKEQRRIDAVPVIPADSALVTFFNFSPGASVLSLLISGPQSASVGSAIEYGDNSSTLTLLGGDYTFDVTYADGDTLTASFDYTISASHKYSAVIYDTLSTLKFDVFTDD